MDRPSTSKPRGICKYYTTPRGCFAGKNCKFLHGESETITPFDKAKTCIYYTKGFCKHGDTCWFLHVDNPTGNTIAVEQDALQEDCSICLDTPSTYGLLSDCSHVFCLPCVRRWRDSQGKSEDIVESGNTKKCPLCRVTSRFIVPSSRFYPESHPGKAKVIEAYKESTKRIPCKYFQETKSSSSPICPFGSECFYAHTNDDGTPYQFSGGASRWMPIYKRRNRPRVYLSDAWDPVDHFAIDFFRFFRNSDLTATLESIRQRLPDLLPDAGHQEEDSESPQNEQQNQTEPAEEAQQQAPRGVTIPDMPASFLALNGNMITGHGTEEENMSLQRVLESIHGLDDDDDDDTYDDTHSPTSDVSMELAFSESSYQDIGDSDNEAQLTPFLVNPSERTTRSLPSSPRRSASSISFDRSASRLSVSSLSEAGPFIQSLIDLNILVSRPATPIVAAPLTATATTTDTSNATSASISSSLSSSTVSHPSPPAAATTLSTAHTTFNSSPLSPYARPFTPALTLLRPTAAFATTTSLTITAPSSAGGGASGHYLRLPSPLPQSPRPSPPSPGRAFAGIDGESSMVIDLDDDSVDDEVCEDAEGAGRSGGVDTGVLTVAAAEDEGQQQRSAPPMVSIPATTITASSPSASEAVPPAGQASSPSPQGANENNNSNSGNNIERRLATLHDSDPPFVTDGRGRVVWSRHGQQQQQQQQQQHRKSAVNVNNTRREGGVEPPAAVVVAATTPGSNDSNSNPGSSAQHAE